MAICPIDGSKIGVFSNWILKDGEICNKCGEKIGLVHGDEKADGLANSITIADAKKFYEDGTKVTSDFVKKRRESDIQAAQEADKQRTEDMQDHYTYGGSFSSFMDQHGLTGADPNAAEQIKRINNEMNGMRWYRGPINFAQFNGPEQAKIANLTTQTEQNWLLINQNEEIKKQNEKIIELLSELNKK
ncbi:hypothetical protein LASUN_13500 [Lentilactobacillus sunkii]|jgi:hypothetical protein|uniref:DUF4428 domain-containing protein n=1 Tax=Lentilactobacillus sunkii TaxID=481719 RepID=A0A1E7XCE7_9LACO|nr:DUF4428 domain-containing protein [Lentilactobacillus sunkii]OFA10800.1 hypothetical protein LASUN_13500 [Lentilactobacillus sunkii]